MEGINKLTSSSATLGWVLMAVRVLMAVLVLCARASTDQTQQPDGDISCTEAIHLMDPCVAFFAGWGSDQPPEKCCSVASTLTALVTTPEQRKAICQCFKDHTSSPQALHRIELLRQACAKGLPIPSDPNQECSK